MQPTLSLITGTRNRPESFQRLVDSIDKHTSVEWELIVSNASDVGYAIAMTKEAAWRTKFIQEFPRLGCSAGYNVAFRQAIGEWAIWLNDDCEVMPGYDTAAIAFMEAHPEIGLGALPYSNKGGPFKVNDNAFDALVYANFGILRRALGNQIGWFDEVVRMYGCDNSIGFRVLLAGFGIAEIPNARILHHEHHDDQRAENLKGQHEDAARLRAKYEPLLPQMRATYERTRMVSA